MLEWPACVPLQWESFLRLRGALIWTGRGMTEACGAERVRVRWEGREAPLRSLRYPTRASALGGGYVTARMHKAEDQTSWRAAATSSQCGLKESGWSDLPRARRAANREGEEKRYDCSPDTGSTEASPATNTQSRRRGLNGTQGISP